MVDTQKDYQLPESAAAAVAAGTNVIKALRESFSYSVEDLAVTCGLTVGEISAIEGGHDSDAGRLRRVTRALGLPDNALPGG